MSEGDIDREAVLSAIYRLASALGRGVIPSNLQDPAARSQALRGLVAELVSLADTVRGHLGAALATESQPLVSPWGLSTQELADKLRLEHRTLRQEHRALCQEHDAACAAILDLQEEQGAYRRGRADGMRLAAEIVREHCMDYTRPHALAAWLRGNDHSEATARVIEDVAVFPDRWQPGSVPPAQPAPPAPNQSAGPVDVPPPGQAVSGQWVGPAYLDTLNDPPDPLTLLPNPTEADLDLAAEAALVAIYGTPGAAWLALTRLGGLLANLPAHTAT